MLLGYRFNDSISNDSISFLILVLLFSSSCSSTSRNDGTTPPQWIHQSARTVDGGYIVYVASGEDRKLEHAVFKAESIALEDIANECSFIPKGTRIEDRYEEQEENQHWVYVKVGLSFEDCEAAKNSTDPESIKKLANASMTSELKRYQDSVEGGQDLAMNSDASPSPTPSPSGTASGATSTVAYYQSPTQYYVARQQVAYMKEVIILAPPSAYPPGSVQSTLWVSRVTPLNQQIQTYETQNPGIRNSPTTWSTLPSRPVVRSAVPFRHTSLSSPPARSASVQPRTAAPSRVYTFKSEPPTQRRSFAPRRGRRR